MSETPEDAQQPAQAVIQAFGGIRPMAHKLGIAVSTVQGWKERGTIPRARHEEILAAARTAGIALEPQLLADSDQTQPPVIEAVATPLAGKGTPAEEPAPEPETAAPESPWSSPPPPARGGLLRALPAAALGGVLVAVGFLLAMGTSDLWLGRPLGGEDQQRLARLEQQLAGLAQPSDGSAALESLRQELLAGVAQSVETATAPELQRLAAALDETRKQISDLEARLALLPPAGAESDEPPAWAADLRRDLEEQNGRLLALEATLGLQASRLEALEQQPPPETAEPETAELEAAAPSQAAATQADGAAGALALAASGLQQAVAAGRPFASELALLEQMTEGDAEAAAPLAVLAPLAESGLPRESDLAAGFPATARAIVAAARGESEDWLDSFWDSLGELVTVRPVGEVEGEMPAARAARAEQRLAAGDLAAAVAELEALSGAPAEAAAPWLAEARRRLEGLAAAEALVRLALGRLAAG